jgi:Zn-dependent M16 (insulinase) family peptidase
MTHNTFEFIRKVRIPSLNTTVEEYRHTATGARHFHLSSQDTNNAFLVAFRTVPEDSTGVAHILEHTTLCGSRQFPVRDPFFMMIRRSLNTFMNAFTANDWTAYPFATQNRKDFDNLLRVYLDAVFFPNLDPLDFAQEGHRVEFAVLDDPSTELEYKGVVYNEMKGAMSSPVRQAWQYLQSGLFPTTTYHYNSGGDPEEIPKLSYEALKAFHVRHYHPSNAVLMTYGSFPVAEHQARIEAFALSRFEAQDLGIEIPKERRYFTPLPVATRYPIDPQEGTQDKTHIVLGWLLGESADLREAMHAELLSDVLLDNSASPLRKALETTDLGTAPSELCGLDNDLREIVFACGLEGSEPDRAEAVERLVLDALEDVAEHGVPLEQVRSVLHQLELAQREVGGGRFPYGLQLMVKALPALLHGADPVGVLDIDPVLTELREQIRDPAFVKSLARGLLLDNPHRVRLSMAPDPELSARREQAVREQLAALKAAMGEDQKRQVVEQALVLKARQETQDDPEILPKVGLQDVPEDLKIPTGRDESLDGIPVTWFEQPTNGLVYQQVVVDLPQLDEALEDELPLFCECLTEVGCGDRDYLQTQAWQAAVTGGVSARASVRGNIEDTQRTRGVFVLAGKALARNQEAMAELLLETFTRARFDELPRLRELLAQMRAYREAQVTGNGHVLAMTAASAGIGPVGALSHRWSGLAGIRKIKKLDDIVDNNSELSGLAERIIAIRDAITAASQRLLVVSEAQYQPGFKTRLTSDWASLSAKGAPRAGFEPAPVEAVVRQAWSTNTQVNFCAKAYPTVALDQPDAPALMVLGPFLRNGFLHRAIREQGGAYGGGAGYSSDTGAFRLFSYRDPRLQETLADFDRALDWLQNASHGARELEEAILGVIGEIDRPDSPAGEAIGTYFGTLHGRTPEQRRRFRSRVLHVTLDDLRRVGERYLAPDKASIAVISDPLTLEQNPELGLEIQHL